MTGALGLLVAASWIALAPAQASAPSNGWTCPERTVRQAQDQWRVEGTTEAGHRPLSRRSVAAAVAANSVREASPDADPVSDGIIRGALIGAGAGVGLVALAYSMCDEGCEAPDAAPVFLLGAGMSAGIGAAIGWLVDSVHKDRPPSARTVSVAPMLAPRYKAVAVRLRF